MNYEEIRVELTEAKVGVITLATPLPPGHSVNVGFLLGVEQTGDFRFFINVEAALDNSSSAPGKGAANGRKGGGAGAARR